MHGGHEIALSMLKSVMTIQLPWWYLCGYTSMGTMRLQSSNRVHSHLAALFACYCVLQTVTVVIVSHSEGDKID